METLFSDGRFRPVKHNSGDKKADVFEWEKDFGAKGRLQNIDKTQLRIDSSYQRRQSKQKALRIARHFKWFGFGIIIASLRSNGNYFVLDGGHRTLAAILRPEVKEVPCLVFSGLSKEQEAKAFIYYNAHRKPPTGIELFAADVVAKDETALAVNKVLHQHGVVVENDQRSGVACRAPRKLMEIHQRDEGRTLDDVLTFVNEIWKGNPDRLGQVALDGTARFADAYKAATGHSIIENGCRDAFRLSDLSAFIVRSNGIREITGKNKIDSFKVAMIQHWNKGRKKNLLPM